MEYNPFCKGDIPYFNLLADISYVDKIQIPHFHLIMFTFQNLIGRRFTQITAETKKDAMRIALSDQ